MLVDQVRKCFNSWLTLPGRATGITITHDNVDIPGIEVQQPLPQTDKIWSYFKPVLTNCMRLKKLITYSYQAKKTAIKNRSGWRCFGIYREIFPELLTYLEKDNF